MEDKWRINYPSSGTTAEKNFKGGNFGIASISLKTVV